MLGVIDDISLLIISKGVKLTDQEINKFRAEFSQLQFLEKLYEEEAIKETKRIDTLNGEETNNQVKKQSFQTEWF